MGGVIFKGKCLIANDSVVEVGYSGILEFGNNVSFNSGLRLSCYKQIIIEDHVLGSWDISIFDTDFHRLKDVEVNELIDTCSKQIKVGKGSWLGFGTTMLKGSVLPQYSVLGAKSLLTKEFITPFTIYAGNPAQAKKKGFFLDKQDCSPEYGMPWGK